MKTKRIIHSVLLVLGLSVVGLLFYYALWVLTDDDFRQEFKNGWPWQSWQMLVDYAACCLFTTVLTLMFVSPLKPRLREAVDCGQFLPAIRERLLIAVNSFSQVAGRC